MSSSSRPDLLKCNCSVDSRQKDYREKEEGERKNAEEEEA
jgi:hypothetical protein